jgi:uncharacterized HAD superfamily protein
MQTICIDVDNVIARTDDVIRSLIHDYTGGRVSLQAKDIKEFDYYKCKDSKGQYITKDEWQEIHEQFSSSRYLLDILPVDHAQESLKALSHKFSIHIATSRLAKARSATIEWLTRHGFAPKGLHFITHREKHLLLRDCFAAVEDDYEQACLFVQTHTPCYLIRYPWNKSKAQIANVTWVESWLELTPILLSTCG